MARARKVFRIEGEERRDFLQGLVTNDVNGIDKGLVYAAVLTPQGKYLADFFLSDAGDAILLDADAEQAPGLVQRLSLYKLRAKVAIEETGLHVSRGTGPAPDGAMPDPRHPDLGWRHYGDTDVSDDTDWDAIRVEHCIPEAQVELIPNETFILEAGFERLHGVDFRKGCYVGQEVTARMKHKTELRKGLATVEISAPVPPGSPITRDGKDVGRVFTHSGPRAIAYLRFDRAGPGMEAAGIAVDLPDCAA